MADSLTQIAVKNITLFTVVSHVSSLEVVIVKLQ
jgi:hypothetical protein